ncbi:MAG: hypothetical protein ACLFMY_07030, partial [Guyparkeria sp.]
MGTNSPNSHEVARLAAALVVLCLLLLPAARAATADASTPVDVTIGVLAYTGKPEAAERWQPTADYLSDRNPDYRFRIEPLFLGELRRAFREDRLDFVLTQPLQ